VGGFTEKFYQDMSVKENRGLEENARLIFAHENAYEILGKLGLKKEVVQLTNYTVGAVMEVVKKKPQLDSLLRSLLKIGKRCLWGHKDSGHRCGEYRYKDR